MHTLKASSSVRSSPMYTGRTLVRSSSNPKGSIREDFYSLSQLARRAHTRSDGKDDDRDDGSMHDVCAVALARTYLPSDLSKNSTALPLSHMIDGRTSTTFLPSVSSSSGKSRSTALTFSANELQLCRGEGGAQLLKMTRARGANSQATCIHA